MQDRYKGNEAGPQKPGRRVFLDRVKNSALLLLVPGLAAACAGKSYEQKFAETQENLFRNAIFYPEGADIIEVPGMRGPRPVIQKPDFLNLESVANLGARKAALLGETLLTKLGQSLYPEYELIDSQGQLKGWNFPGGLRPDFSLSYWVDADMISGNKAGGDLLVVPHPILRVPAKTVPFEVLISAAVDKTLGGFNRADADSRNWISEILASGQVRTLEYHEPLPSTELLAAKEKIETTLKRANSSLKVDVDWTTVYDPAGKGVKPQFSLYLTTGNFDSPRFLYNNPALRVLRLAEEIASDQHRAMLTPDAIERGYREFSDKPWWAKYKPLGVIGQVDSKNTLGITFKDKEGMPVRLLKDVDGKSLYFVVYFGPGSEDPIVPVPNSTNQ